VESSWSYRYSPAIKKKMRERISGLPPQIQAIAWEAQHRLHKKCQDQLKITQNNQLKIPHKEQR
jgi:hypothetical protein